MLRQFTQTPPSVHLLLLVLIPLLRLPVFFGGYHVADEELTLLAAAQAAGEGKLYLDAWFAGPPLQVWLYQAFYVVLGDHALTALRICTMLGLYLLAVHFNGFLARSKVIRRYEGLPAVVLVLFTCTPWHSLELSGELLAVWPLLVGFERLLSLTGEGRSQQVLPMLFGGGVLAGMGILFSYKAVFLGAGLVLGLLILRTANFAEVFALLSGLLVPLLGLLLVLYAQGNLAAYYSIGFEYYWQRVTLAGEAYYPYATLPTLQSVALCWLPLGLLALIGFFHYRTRFYSYVARIRAIETSMALWLVLGLLIMALKLRRLDVSDFILLAPPLAFYASAALTFRWPRLLRLPGLAIGLTAMVLLYVSSYALPYPGLKTLLTVEELPTWLGGRQSQWQALPETLTRPGGPQGEKLGSVWVLDHQPQWYRELGTVCPYPYLDFRMVYYKFPMLPGYDPAHGIASEPEGRIFETFAQQPPALILDPEGHFSYLQARFPSLFEAYRPDPRQPFSVYWHPSLPLP